MSTVSNERFTSTTRVIMTHREVDGRRRVARLDAHHARLDLGRRTEVVAADLEQLVHLGQQLRVD
jgi:hypothetical protein